MEAKVKVTLKFEYTAKSEHYDNPETISDFEQKIADYDSIETLLEIIAYSNNPQSAMEFDHVV